MNAMNGCSGNEEMAPLLRACAKESVGSVYSCPGAWPCALYHQRFSSSMFSLFVSIRVGFQLVGRRLLVVRESLA